MFFVDRVQLSILSKGMDYCFVGLMLTLWRNFSVDIFCIILTSRHSFCCNILTVQVREIVAVLDLDILFYPCPRNGPNFRSKVVQMGGKTQFPYMVRLSPHNNQQNKIGSFLLWFFGHLEIDGITSHQAELLQWN